MLGYVVNYQDEQERRGMPSGLLVVNPTTSKLIAVGKSPLSTIATKVFLEGVHYGEYDKMMQYKTLKSRPGDPGTFETVGSKWLAGARLRLQRIDIRVPLRDFVPIKLDLTTDYDNPSPFETIALGAAP